MIKKFRVQGGKGFPVVFNPREIGMDKVPNPGLIKHVQLPPQTSKDIITFGAKYVESRENLNRAYFANSELAKAYHTIPYKALDLEHELEDIVGHIYSSAYIDRDSGSVLDPDKLIEMSEEDLEKLTIDVVVGGVVYVDRFPRLEVPVADKAYKISMETYFDTFDVLLENGVRVSLEEAEALGLGLFIEQLMGEFETQEEFDDAHKIRVRGFDINDLKKERTMEIYKYLKGILFSGGGLVLNPACPSCHILSTDRDEACDCTDSQEAASTKVKEKKETEFLLDLNKFEPYAKELREGPGGKKTVHQVKENIEEATSGDDLSTPVLGPFDPSDTYDNTDPSVCPSYKAEYVNDKGITQRFWCLYMDKQCMTAANRQDKDCHRWFRQGENWIFDTRSYYDPTYSPKEAGPEPENPTVVKAEDTVNDNNVKMRRAVKSLIDGFSFFLESKALNRELKKKEEAAVWTTKYINDLPNSSFAVVEKGYKAGESPKTARHLPFKDAQGKVDLPHLRNALARANQIKSVLGTESDEALRSRAKAKLARYSKRYLKTDSE